MTVASGEHLEPARHGAEVIISPSAPFDVAKTFLQLHYTRADIPTLHHHRGEFFEWSGAAYQPVDDDNLRSRLYHFLARCFTGSKNEKGDFEKVRVRPNMRMVGAVLDALKAAAHLYANVAPPAWLLDDADFAAADLIACRNGVLHWPTGNLLPHSPSFFNLNGVDFDYRYDVNAPVAWLRFLKQLWPDDPTSIATLQELFGLALVDDVSHQKVFLLIGPRRSGKGTIARVLTKMVGLANTAAPTLHSLGTEFGLQPLINKRLAVIGDARIGAKTDTAAVVERLLSISGEDLQNINRKNTSFWIGQLRVRFLIITNELPHLADTSGALAGRFIILALTNSFFGQEDHGLAEKLFAEMPGILSWSLEGLRRLRTRGHFVPPTASAELVEELDIMTSPTRAFLRDRCEFGAGYGVPVDLLYQDWLAWCQEQHRDKPGTKQAFGAALRTAWPALKISQLRTAGSRERWYEGIRRNHD